MCKPISWWLVCHGDDRKVLISDKTDSHSDAAKEFGIKDGGIGRVAAGEFWPDPENPSPDAATWKLIWDYSGCDRKPGWLDADDEALLRSELERRAKEYIITTTGAEVKSCRAFLFGKATAKAKGNSRVEAWGSSSVEAWGSSSVVARGSSRVVARDSSSVVAWESSSVVAWDSSRVVARESSSVVARESSSVVAWESSSVVAWESSSVEARGSSRVEARGSSRVEACESSSVVAWDSSRVVARESSSVEAWESSSVEAWGSSSVVARESSSVVASSKYSCLIFRKAWDGNGYIPVWCPHNGDGRTYRAANNEAGYEVVEAKP